MKTIYAITDYKGHFGSKWQAIPYRSGYDLGILSSKFREYGYQIKFVKPNEIIFDKKYWEQKKVLLTSSEEPELNYKNYLDDIAFGLKHCNARLIPSIKFLQTHENKIKSIIIQNMVLDNSLRILTYKPFGNYEELKVWLKQGAQKYPYILKKPIGSKGSGVYLVRNEVQLKRTARKISSTFKLKRWLKEKIRSIIHKGYTMNSMYSKPFMIQEFIPNLSCDWKVLIYGSHIYILKRRIKKDDFRASGSGHGYKSGESSEFPLDYLETLYQFQIKLETPNISIDFGYDGSNGFIFEFQALYFGTSTQFKSSDYYKRTNGTWELKKNNMSQESIYAKSIVEFIETK